MSKTLLTAILMALIFLFLVVRYAQHAYQVLPSTPAKVLVTTPYESWKPFSVPEKFSVSLPLPPQEATETIRDSKTGQKRYYKMYVAQANDGTAYMVSLITYSKKDDTDENLLHGFMNDMVSASPKNTLQNAKDGDFRGFPDLTFTISNEESTLLTKAFMVDNTLVLLSAMTKDVAAREHDIQHFFDSFQLLKESGIEKKK